MSPPSRGFLVTQEREGVPGRSIALVALVAIGVAVVATGVAGLLLGEQRGAIADRAAAPGAWSAAPDRLGVLHATDIRRAPGDAATRAAQRRELDQYRWVDRDAGIAEIPIERAMDIVVERSRP